MSVYMGMCVGVCACVHMHACVHAHECTHICRPEDDISSSVTLHCIFEAGSLYPRTGWPGWPVNPRALLVFASLVVRTTGVTEPSS